MWGGRLLPLLAESGRNVRCLVRHPERLAGRVPAGAEVLAGDVFDADSLAAAMRGVHCAYYLVHSLGASGDFEEQDRRAADLFASAASAAGVRRIIYLGGLGVDTPELSPHLRSRHEVGERLRAHGVPVIELRASIIIGSGSLSFEMIRALVERLPVMVTPRWVRVTAQPIAIGDVLGYLLGALALPAGEPGRIIEIGGERPRLVRRPDARVRAPARAAPRHDSRAVAHAPAVQPVAGTHHPGVCAGRPQTH